ncbi:MAG: hypothetical protein KC618_05295, partial [Candidatus Omnitrophica bacterium]|nr:hypothetical protein [Candidatus Omnitrophota bacterium]
NETCIGIPFYLAHPRLIQLEKKFMVDAEGEGRGECMKLLRHEAGHALCYAYRLHRRKLWKKTFGPPEQEYADTYKYRPYSKNYVRHLDGFYAQYHPDEDFVETFAVWLAPNSEWRKRYVGWKALQKLEYVDQLMNEIRNRPPLVESSRTFWRLSTLRMPLGNHYKKKRNYLAEEFPDFHDRFLKKLFPEPSHKTKLLSAAKIISQYRTKIINSVSRFSGERKYIVNELLKGIRKRARELKLVSSHEESDVVIQLSVYITALIMNYSYTGQFRGQKKV